MTSSVRILIADNDENILSTTAHLFQREGYQCRSARDGREALRALEENEYNLLIAEVRMPGNEELELVQAARRCMPRMPVIISTGHPTLHSALAAIELSVAAYLIKPVEFSLLLHKVEVSLANHRDLKLYGSEDTREQIDRLTSAIEETIQILQSTRGAFKSQQLAALRVKLQQLLASGQSK